MSEKFIYSLKRLFNLWFLNGKAHPEKALIGPPEFNSKNSCYTGMLKQTTGNLLL
jgi:hypothetical protein